MLRWTGQRGLYESWALRCGGEMRLKIRSKRCVGRRTSEHHDLLMSSPCRTSTPQSQRTIIFLAFLYSIQFITSTSSSAETGRSNFQMSHTSCIHPRKFFTFQNTPANSARYLRLRKDQGTIYAYISTNGTLAKFFARSVVESACPGALNEAYWNSS